MRTLRNFINGAWLDSASNEYLQLVNPANEQPIGLLPAGSEADVEQAVGSALVASAAWAARPLEERLNLLEVVCEVVVAHARELAEIECEEMGRPVTVGERFIRAYADRLRASLDEARDYSFVREVVADDRQRTLVSRHPVGVIALIVPWNFASATILAAIGPPLASGNTIVLKPSEKASLAPTRLLELIDLPPGVLNMVLGDGRSGSALSQHPSIGLTHFTGSVSAGRSVAMDGATNLRRVILELGGKDPVIVDADVDIAATAREVAVGSFLNTGQICTSMERVYVHRDIADRFIEALVAEAKAYTHGDGRDVDVLMGPLVDERQRNTVAAHVQDAVERGAVVRTGGQVSEGRGFFYPATVLTDVTDDMVIMREETFGPIAPVQVVDSFEEALTKAEGTNFGLGATVYSNDPEHIRAAQRLPAAFVWINKWRGNSAGSVHEPAGHSGMGAVGHFATFDAVTRPSAIVQTIVRAGGEP